MAHQRVVEQAGLDVEIVKEESYERMMALGVLATPAVAIDGAVVVSGRIPKAEAVPQPPRNRLTRGANGCVSQSG